ncbi:hypothetical protein H5410_060059 [Solanum commersonii]|uniref:HAT C-terminal dimerisation domain-containing protein n=1 Tax=Solanum commersonii TaxID=4109 RepID=A0A9J5W431_SOLCO|nr:hypothetical protein H5410_060059 [Solanum commersonii]
MNIWIDFAHPYQRVICLTRELAIGKSKRKSPDVTYSHHMSVEICYVFINLHLQELNKCFNVVSSDLLLGMTSLNPVSSFGGFDKTRIMRLTEYYMNEFDSNKLRDLSCQIDNFILTLILRVATVSVERAFSSMKYIKNELRNNIDDEFLNGCVVLISLT